MFGLGLNELIEIALVSVPIVLVIVAAVLIYRGTIQGNKAGGSVYTAARKDNQIACPKCGDINPATNTFCGGCGSKLAETSPKYCTKCGAQGLAGSNFCPKCGNEIM